MSNDLDGVELYYPGNPAMADWEVTDEVDFRVGMDRDDLVVSWPFGSFSEWYSEIRTVGPAGPVDIFGVAGLLYDTGRKMVGDASEYCRNGREDAGVRFNFGKKRRHESKHGYGSIANPGRIGIVVAGMWRHEARPIPAWWHRTRAVMFEYPSLKRIETSGPDPDPDRYDDGWDDALTQGIIQLERLRGRR